MGTRFVAEPAVQPQPRPGANVAELTVSELSNAIKRSLEDAFGYVRLRGEISGYRGPHASGHCYFALKDDRAKIEAVIWKGTFGRLRFKPEEGMEVVAQGRVTTYPGSSKYQIVIEALEPAGAGALMAVLEERKRRLAAEGLFEESRKRKLPFLPRVVGIVTSPTGAVIRDMLHGFNERFPTHVVLWPVRVQGEGSSAEVAAAVRGFNAIATGGRLPRPDVLIVARGGGSLEDLWGFNDEAVVRAVAESAIPVISAVGHETDWTLIDLVADARAPTPTKAAEWAVPKHSELAEATLKCGTRLGIAIRRVLEAQRTHLKAAARGLPRPADLVSLPRQRFDTADKRLARALLANTRAHATRLARVAPRLTPRLISLTVERARNRVDQAHRHSRDALARLAATRRARLERTAGRLSLEAVRSRMSRCHERLGVMAERSARAFRHVAANRRRQLDGASKLLATLSYQSVLRRGFALVTDNEGRAVRSVATVRAGAVLGVEVADGRFAAQALEGGATNKDGERLAAAPKPPSGRKEGSQGSLF
jgi:exodeoxyribonuclease VII large subunit